MDKSEFGAYQAVQKCMKIQPGERVVIIADRKTEKTSITLEKAVLKVTPNLKFFLMEDFGQRPLAMPPIIMAALRGANASFYTADYVDGELPIFRRPIYELVGSSSLRHAGMPMLTRQILEQGMNADYSQLAAFSKRVFEVLSKARVIEVSTPAGTEIRVEVGRYKWGVCDGNIKPGTWSNLPDGEVFTSPQDVNGRVVIDGVLGDYFDGKYGCITETPLEVEVQNGRAINGTLKCAHPGIREDLQDYIFRENSPNSTRVGEFAMGTNLALKEVIGNLLQDEKFPSVHIAFGDCYSDMTGCEMVCDYHVDGVMLKPTVKVDGKEIMREGIYLIN